jgi:dTDP-4-dehydrorhamnose 3,5-epimerase
VKIEPTEFKDVLLINLESHNDNRGSFRENFRLDKLEHFVKRKINFCQENLAHSKKGVIRGLHYQLEPFCQSKLISVIKGEVLDIVLDIRKGSPNFGKHISFTLNEVTPQQLFIPRGYAHGYITLSEESIFHYKVDNYYHKASEGSIAFDDPKLKIDWILPSFELIVSEKDMNHPALEDAPLFDYKDDLYD